MFSEPSRIADAINNPRFHSGDRVILAKGPYKYTRGIFLALKQDVKWAAIRESNGVANSHPVDWLRSDSDESSADATIGRKAIQ